MVRRIRATIFIVRLKFSVTALCSLEVGTMNETKILSEMRASFILRSLSLISYFGFSDKALSLSSDPNVPKRARNVKLNQLVNLK